ncbi:hypothetical protein HD806DRAFT_67856 [Xylariaceae sp. AK1471]|nr:hypothetical protein HD806DRAFT_67856 [Xylariaceae sp. AK1471]
MGQRFIPTLHHLDHSAAFRCLWALEELKETNGIIYNLKNYRRQRGFAPSELSDIFPIGKSPILTLESTVEGEDLPTFQIITGVLTEAQLILRFLSDEYGNGLWDPANEDDKNRDVFFQGFAMMTFVPKMDMPVALETIISLLPFGISALSRLLLSPLISSRINDLEPIFQLLENALGEEKPWFSGRKFGLADFNICWGMDMASQREYFEPSRFPKLAGWHVKVKGRTAYRSALEKGNGYDLKTFGLWTENHSRRKSAE